jgi:hypothetical protein
MTNNIPVAWMYELASFYDKDAKEKYSCWTRYVTFSKPCVPEAAIRNLIPLYTKMEE